MSSKERKGPLRKIRVIELCNMVAGPFCAGLLADYGADVIKIEAPSEGDPFRKLLPVIEGESLRWPTMGRNKRSITLNMKSEEGIKIVLDLIKDADMVIENFRPGVIEKWGLTYEKMKAVNPKIVLCRISGYGQSGPYRHKAGFGTALTAFSGYTSINGYPDRPPISPVLSLADLWGGVFALMGGLSAVISILSGNSDEGQVVDTSLYEPLLRIQEGYVTEYSLTGKVYGPSIMDNSIACPVATLLAKDDKYVILVCSNQRTWERCAQVIGGDEFKNNPKFADNILRMKNQDEVMSVIVPWAKERTSTEICNMFDEVGVPCCKILTVEDMIDNPQYIERESIIKVEHDKFGLMDMVNIFPYFSGTKCEVRNLGPTLGADNDDVYLNQLRIDKDKYEKMKKENII